MLLLYILRVCAFPDADGKVDYSKENEPNIVTVKANQAITENKWMSILFELGR